MRRKNDARFRESLDDDSALPCHIGFVEVIVKPARANLIQRSSLSNLSGIQKTYLVDARTICVGLHRVGGNGVRTRVAVEERYVPPGLDPHFGR